MCKAISFSQRKFTAVLAEKCGKGSDPGAPTENYDCFGDLPSPCSGRSHRAEPVGAALGPSSSVPPHLPSKFKNKSAIEMVASRWHLPRLGDSCCHHKGLLSCQGLLSQLQLHHPLLPGTEQGALRGQEGLNPIPPAPTGTRAGGESWEEEERAGRDTGMGAEAGGHL